jgi:hypothetical protein
MVQAERRLGLGIPTPTVEQQKERPQLTHEDMVDLVGENYQDLVNQKLRNLGHLREDEALVFNFPGYHNGSDALYAYEGKIGDHWVFVQYMRRNSRTTLHKHLSSQMQNFFEDYHVLNGEMAVITGKAGEPLTKTLLNEENPHFRVEPDTRHRVVTYEEPAYNLVVMPGSSHISRDQLHSD